MFIVTSKTPETTSFMEQFGTIWDAAAFILKTAKGHSAGRVLSEIEFLDQALLFANTGSAKSLSVLLGQSNPPASMVSDVETQSSFARATPEDQSAKHRKRFRHFLDAVAEKNFHTELRAFMAVNAGEVVLIPQYGRRDEHLVTEYRVVPRNLPSALAYVLLLLFDDDRPHGARLCKCQLVGCGAFFFEKRPDSGTGRPRRNYCREDHMKEAHDLSAARRVAKSRAVRAVQRNSRQGGAARRGH